MLMDNDAQFVQSNIAAWILTSASAAFLFIRLYCRIRFSHIWWDDLVLTISWLILFISCALLSRSITAGYETTQDKRAFFLYHHISTTMTTIATSWTKVAFAVTLIRIVQNRAVTYFLWAIITTANAVIIMGILSIWIPGCGDPLTKYRPEHELCWPVLALEYLGGITIVYGGVIDILLALFPWFIIRKVLLQTREKIGLAFAMSLGALTGIVVILRAFFQFIDPNGQMPTENRYHFMVFVSIFNFMEPSVTIIAQTIPMFRVLLFRSRWDSEMDICLDSVAPRHVELTDVKSNA